MDVQIHTVYLSLGSNKGDRRKNLNLAVEQISNRIGSVVSQSDFFVTEPVGFKSAHLFYNIAIGIETTHTAADILEITQQIEKELGRKRKSVNGVYHDRVIDIDILLYDDCIINTPELQIPHPRMKERRFVLEPLAQIAPALIIPDETKTITELLSDIC